MTDQQLEIPAGGGEDDFRRWLEATPEPDYVLGRRARDLANPLLDPDEHERLREELEQ